MKAILTLVVVVLTGMLLVSFCYEPYRCNQKIKAADRSTTRVLDITDRFYVARVARENIRSMEPCLTHNPSGIAAWMIAAANRRLIGQHDEAARLYEEALRYDRRPELYLQLGLTYLELHRTNEAVAALERAVRFDPETLDEVIDPDVRSRILARIAALPR